MIIHWLLVVFINGSLDGVVIGEGHPSKAACEAEWKTTQAVAAVQFKAQIQDLRHLCVIQEKKQGA